VYEKKKHEGSNMTKQVPTVKDAVYQILRNHKIDTVFGNPGSNELHFLKDFPADFQYVLCLDEGVVVGMADGYAQASGQPSFVNLHSAAGTGNAMGALTNSRNSHSPIVVTSGQQARSMVFSDPLLKNTDATTLPKPLVKDSYEPLSPQEVPYSINRAINLAVSDAPGPVYVSIPYDDWEEPARENLDLLLDRKVVQVACVDPSTIQDLRERIAQAQSPVLVLGPEVDSAGCNDLVARLAERMNAPAWVAPSAPRCPFPTNHRCFAGILPAGEASLCDKIKSHDFILVIGGPVFRYHQKDPGALLPQGALLVHVTSDADEAARAPMGDALITGIQPFVEQLYAALPEKEADCPVFKQDVVRNTNDGAALTVENLFDCVEEIAPANSIYLNEATSTLATLWSRLTMATSGSYYFAAAGGLGFALPAALGVQMACPGRQVIAFIGDGSMHYSISALWTAMRYQIPAIFIVLNNNGYMALRWFAELFDVDIVKIAEGYGVKSEHVDSLKSFKLSLAAALESNGPSLIEVKL
jgi:benzoylformate decarboxylase